MCEYDELYIICDREPGEAGCGLRYSDAHLVFVETMHPDAQAALGNGSPSKDTIVSEYEFEAIPIWRIVEKLEEHGLFQGLVDEFITSKKGVTT